MKKIALGFMLLAVPLLSGCSLPKVGGGGSSASPAVSFLRSTDGGTTFESKSTIDEKTNFATAEVISMATDKQDTRRIFLGTKESGIFASDNSGDSWRKIVYPPTKVYGLVIDATNSQHLFATGEYDGRGKIYQTVDGGENWTEVYTEPANGTVITSIAQNPYNPRVIYAGTSTGMIIRSNDGGETWKNITFTPSMSGNIIWNITFDNRKDNLIYFLVGSKGVYVADGDKIVNEPVAGGSFAMVTGNAAASSSGAMSLVIDTNRNGVLYVGTAKGIFRSTDYAKTWTALNIIESSKKFPISGIAVNPKDSNEIVYIAGLTLYKSTDGGIRWATRQIASDKNVSFLRYDAYNPGTLFIGFKK